MNKADMLKAISKMMRGLGVEELAFADEAGNQVGPTIKAAPRKRSVRPLEGRGDAVRRGDRATVRLVDPSAPSWKAPVEEFGGLPVTVQDYSPDPSDPWMVVLDGKGATISFHWDHRLFKKVP